MGGTFTLEWLAWCGHQLWHKAWNALTFEQQDQYDQMARAYNDAEQHHPLHRPRIQHALNTGKFHIPDKPYFADGFDADTSTVYEFWDASGMAAPRVSPTGRNLTIGITIDAWPTSIATR